MLLAGSAGVAVAVGMAVLMAVAPVDGGPSSVSSSEPLTSASSLGPDACASSVTRAALPEWARSGFSDDGSGIPHVVGAGGDLIGVLFRYPPIYSADPAVTTKILWVARPQDGPGPEPRIDGLRLTAGLAGTSTEIRRELPQGPGPSGVNFPSAGCWIVTARWATYQDVLAVPVG